VRVDSSVKFECTIKCVQFLTYFAIRFQDISAFSVKFGNIHEYIMLSRSVVFREILSVWFQLVGGSDDSGGTAIWL